MLIDSLLPQEIDAAATRASQLSDCGYDGAWVGESAHDPWLQSLVAAERAPAAQVGTAVVIAFARSPMTVASSAFDLARYTEGRFVLGLGTQIRPHIERRFSMPWSDPVERMRDFMAALRAIWAAWSFGVPLRHRGPYYTHDLMTPVFSPAAHRWGAPPVYLAAVGKGMLRLTGEGADGLIVHPFHSRAYLDDVIRPAVADGARSAGRAPEDVAVVGSVLVATGSDAAELAAATEIVRGWLSFYASTPAYRAVLAHHGWADLHEPMRALSKEGRWDEMARCLPDEVVRGLAVVGPPDEAGRIIAERYAGRADRLSLNLAGDPAPAVHAAVVAAVRAGLTPRGASTARPSPSP
ncbi:MAG TPA: TIGR03617 family F420-dependent LLM class oxidoreductase [Acidimicrobiia bacterium]|nr:TIGR03617 family F420-dependent LLM class oxidoreductase [Acidimicrobiia bacterium]